MTIEVYTDGSATTRDKPGGYGWVIVIDGVEKFSGSGGIPSATNNDAELEAAIQGLAYLLKLGSKGLPFVPGDVFLVSDSQIILNWASGRNRFKQESKIEKYNQLRELMKRTNALTRWVEGHSGQEFNEKCDKMARQMRNEMMGIFPKKRIDKAKILKKSCDEMADVLGYINREMLDLKHNYVFTRDDIIDKIEEVLELWSEAKEKLK